MTPPPPPAQLTILTEPRTARPTDYLVRPPLRPPHWLYGIPPPPAPLRFFPFTFTLCIGPETHMFTTLGCIPTLNSP